MNNNLNIKISAKSLIRFALPTIISMVFMSVYMMTDGIFVARLINTTALSAVNIIMPLIMVSVALGMMLATGGSAIIAKKMGEGKEQEAREHFSMLIVYTLIEKWAKITENYNPKMDRLNLFHGALDTSLEQCMII